MDVYRASDPGHYSSRIEHGILAPIDLFQAREREGSDRFMDLRPAWGWQDRSQQGVFVNEVPGTHITMMASPQVEILARCLWKILKGGQVCDGELSIQCATPQSDHQRG